MTTSTFDTTAETNFRSRVASYAGVSTSQVSVSASQASGRRKLQSAGTDIQATIDAASAANAVDVRSQFAGFTANSATSYFGIDVTGTPTAADNTNAASITYSGPPLYSASGISTDDSGMSTGAIIGIVAGGAAAGAYAVPTRPSTCTTQPLLTSPIVCCSRSNDRG